MLRYTRTDVSRYVLTMPLTETNFKPDSQTQHLATDFYSSYFFFSLSSRLPLFWLLVSLLGLIVFLASMAWQAWNEAALVMMVLAGALVSLQGIVWCVHCCAMGVGRGLAELGRGMRWIGGSVVAGAGRWMARIGGRGEGTVGVEVEVEREGRGRETQVRKGTLGRSEADMREVVAAIPLGSIVAPSSS